MWGVGAKTLAAVTPQSAADPDTDTGTYPNSDSESDSEPEAQPLGSPSSEVGRVAAQADETVNKTVTGLTRVSFRNHQTDGASGTVRSAQLSEGGYMSIHDAHTRLYDGAPAEQRVLESLIGVTELLSTGTQSTLEVPLFESPAPAVDQFGCIGPFEENQPLYL
jgi:hypothetical protein